MKKLLILASAALLFAGCSGSLSDNGKEGEWNISFTAAQEGVGTKAAIGSSSDGKTAVNWQASDRLTVFDGAAANCEFVTRNFDAGNPTSCRFEGTVSELAADYTAVYPYKCIAVVEFHHQICTHDKACELSPQVMREQPVSRPYSHCHNSHYGQQLPASRYTSL